ncbi:dehydrogenase/reductase SDR family member 11-like isoform X1 [Macrosteles quadrilineatus]|uniref:dehydrogenase/reductase SDR family member 11-like isoform X1 n=1 Tax=Macrosteles quadrilineatus TaxID=74068 RepID=UPI0023E12029|nr:dehydrogenase/reductase SDR family member 11-like isoform X1 [Macrosteles quadrilineatus]
MDRWHGRVAVVTGASSNTGAAIIRALVTGGMTVVAVARRDTRIQVRMQELVDELKDSSGKLYPVKADVTKEEDVTAAFRWIERNVGGVDVLVNNADISISTHVADGRMSEWRRMFDLNVIALGSCCREAIASMRARRIPDGQIINVNNLSIHRVSPFPLGSFVYCASKRAARVLTEGLRRELAATRSKIKVTCVSTSVSDPQLVEVVGWNEDVYLNKVFFHSKDIADTVIFVLSAPPNVQKENKAQATTTIVGPKRPV